MKRRDRFVGPITLLALLALPLTDSLPLLGAMICEESIGMIAGPRGSGKTFLLLLIAYAIAGAKKLLPWGAGVGAPVCYMDGEMRPSGLKKRLASIHAKNTNQKSLAEINERFHVISRALARDPIGSIDTPEGQQKIERLLPEGIKLLIIDNLSAWTSGGREDAIAWAAIKAWLMTLRDRGIAVLIVHHAGKNGQQRGSSAHEDLLDFSILLSPLPSSTDRDDTRFSIEHTKLRDHIPELKKMYECSIWTEDGVLQHEILPMDARLSELTVEILRLRDEGLNQTETAIRLGVHKSTVSRALKNAPPPSDGEAAPEPA